MRVSRKPLLVLPLLLLVVAVVAVRAGEARADAPYVDTVLARTSVQVDYILPPGVQAAISEEHAIATARRYANASPTAVVHSARLGLYKDLADPAVLVWVIDLEGVNRAAHRRPVETSLPPRIITREVWMISATEPDQAVASFAMLPPLR